MDTDEAELHALLRASAPGAIHRMTHYLYLRSHQAVLRVGAELQTRGYEVVEDRNVLGPGWHLLAHHLVVPSRDGLRKARELFESLADGEGGDYDGWEAELLSPLDRRAAPNAPRASASQAGEPSAPTASPAPPAGARTGRNAPASTG